jgi:hypothetical protein
MVWVDLVTVLALLQFLYFGVLVGQARGKYKVPGPATTGHEMFERYFRVQMNTLELLVVLIPALWMAAGYWPAGWMSLIAAVYLVGRFVYLRGYTNPQGSRTLGFVLSFIPVIALLLASLIGLCMTALNY